MFSRSYRQLALCPLDHVIVVTCYLRHLKPIFETTGIQVTSENRKEIDRLIHSVVGVRYKDCPVAWKEVKKRIAEDEEAFAIKLKRLMR